MRPWAKILPFLFLLAGLFSSCSKHDHSAQIEPEDGCWNLMDSVSLSVEITDTTVPWDLTFPLEFTDDYPYSNLYVQLGTYTPAGQYGKATYRFRLMDEMGNWDGEYAGSKIRFKASVGPGIKFNQLGQYRMVLRHFMRDDELCGISSAAIALHRLN